MKRYSSIEKRKPKNSILLLSIIGGVVILCGVAALFFLLSFLPEDHTVDFEKGWTLYFDGSEYEDVNMDQFVFPKVCGRGDGIVLKNTIPESIDETMNFRILLYLSQIDVRVGDEARYSYGEGLNKEGRLVGSGYHYIPIRPWEGGKEIEIVIRPGEDNAFSSITGVALIPSVERVSIFARTYFLTFFVSIFLVMLGFAILATSFATFFRRIKNIRLFHIGCFSLLIGLWSMCSDKLISLFSPYREFNTALEYLALYAAVIPFISLIIDMRSEVSPARKVVLHICRGAFEIFLLISLILHFTGIAHFPAVLTYFHVLVGVGLLMLVLAAVKPLKKMDRADRFMNVGIFVFALSGGIDVARFNLQKYYLVNTHSLDGSILPIGALIFIIFLIMSYLVYMYEEMIAQTEKHTLEKLAYEDSLTGLYNRTRSEERFAELTSGNVRYGLVGIDLNGLKAVNDTLGHAQGDALIRTFGNILEESFGDIGETYRMGGDEFMVIVEERSSNSIDRAIEEMEKRCRQASERNPFKVEAAYGVAFSDEGGLQNAEEVCKKADKRMYEMKQGMKGQEV